MSEHSPLVTFESKSSTDRLPDHLSEGVVLLQWLEGSGLLSEIEDRLRIQREGGYCGIDLAVFLILYFAADLFVGIKEFGARTSKHRKQLAGLGGRKRFAAPSSVSRMLSAVDDELGDEFGAWLLLEGCGARAVLNHPSVRTHDTYGRPWHVFDLDPTGTVLRQRALPANENLPLGRRRSHELKKGYCGRKRGDVKLSRTIVQHAGSGLWLGLRTKPGNGEWRRDSWASVETVRQICKSIGHDPSRALLRVDGAAGNTPFMTACRRAGLRFLTRWSQYYVLDVPEIREHLNESLWYEVEDSGSGPERQAAELGWCTLPQPKGTKQDDGSPFPPVRARMVVSRYKSDTDHGVGRHIDGWKYEVFITNLGEGAWPATELVTTYYGRTAEENRFSQEDRELGLDRIFSYHIPGQNLANLFGLFVWNLRICRGMALLQPPPVSPQQRIRKAEIASEMVLLTSKSGPNERAPEEIETSAVARAKPADLGPAPSVGREEIKSIEVASLETLAGTAAEATEIEPASVFDDEAKPAVEEALAEGDAPIDAQQPSPAEAKQMLDAALCALDWDYLLAHRDGWLWDDDEARLLCPAGHPGKLAGIRIYPNGNSGCLRYQQAPYHCRGCPKRNNCTESESPEFRRETAIHAPVDSVAEIGRYLAQSRGANAQDRRRVTPKKGTEAEATDRPSRRIKAEPHRWVDRWQAPTGNNKAGTFALDAAILQPAVLRHAFSALCRDIEAHVDVRSAPPKAPMHIAFATTAAQRQRRRLTWKQRNARNSLEAQDRVQVRFQADKPVRDRLEVLLLRDEASRRQAQGRPG